MKSILSLVFPFPKDYTAKNNPVYFTVIVTKKFPHYLAGKAKPTYQEKIVYSDIVQADSREQAAFEALFNYFVQRLIKLHQYESSRDEKIQETSFWASRLASKVIEYLDTNHQIFTPFIKEWHLDDGIVVSFE